MKKDDRTYYNFHNLRVLRDKSPEIFNDRLKIDAGNCLRVAVDITMSKNTELHETLRLVLDEFKFAQKRLSEENDAIIEPKDVDKNDAGVNSNGEY